MRFADPGPVLERLSSGPVASTPGLFDVGIYSRRWKLIAGTVLACLLLGVLVGLFRPHTYTARVSLLIGTRAGQSGPIVADGEHRANSVKLIQLRARRARLQAEIAGVAALAIPPELAGSVDDLA